MSDLINSLHTQPHPSWNEFLTDEIISEIEQIEEKISDTNYTPKNERVLHFLTLDLSQIKVIILGQDPYPQEGVATGRAFEVGTLTDWNKQFRNVSLKNIVRLIHYTYSGEFKSYKEVIKQNNDDQNILPPGELFKNWEKQGVLLLNTAFTCEIGKSASHSKLWKSFSSNLHQFISLKYPEIYWILWGNHAQTITTGLPLRNDVKSNHPMMCSNKNENDFLYGKVNTLGETKHLVDWRGTSKNSNNKYRQTSIVW